MAPLLLTGVFSPAQGRWMCYGARNPRCGSAPCFAADFRSTKREGFAGTVGQEGKPTLSGGTRAARSIHPQRLTPHKTFWVKRRKLLKERTKKKPQTLQLEEDRGPLGSQRHGSGMGHYQWVGSGSGHRTGQVNCTGRVRSPRRRARRKGKSFR